MSGIGRGIALLAHTTTRQKESAPRTPSPPPYKTMKTKPLAASLAWHSLMLAVGPASFIPALGQICHYLVTAKHHRVYAAVEALVVACGATTVPGNFATIRVDTFSGLLHTLTGLLKGDVFADKVLHNLVIDNLLVFYWDLRVLNAYNYARLGFDSYVAAKSLYLRLMDVVESIRDKYRCNVVVCSFDVGFDMGYQGNRDSVQTHTSLPEDYIKRHDMVVHVKPQSNHPLEQSLEQWVRLK